MSELSEMYRQTMDASLEVGRSVACERIASNILLILDGKVSTPAVIQSTLYMSKLTLIIAQEHAVAAQRDMELLGTPTAHTYGELAGLHMCKGAAETYEKRINGLSFCQQSPRKLAKYALLLLRRARKHLDNSLELCKDVVLGVDDTDYRTQLAGIDALMEEVKVRMEGF